MRRIDYDEISSRYDRHRRVDESVARMVLSSGRPPERSAVLGLGCGTGSLTRHIERLRRGPVVGLDLSEGMLEEGGLPAEYAHHATVVVARRNE